MFKNSITVTKNGVVIGGNTHEKTEKTEHRGHKFGHHFGHGPGSMANRAVGSIAGGTIFAGKVNNTLIGGTTTSSTSTTTTTATSGVVPADVKAQIQTLRDKIIELKKTVPVEARKAEIKKLIPVDVQTGGIVKILPHGTKTLPATANRTNAVRKGWSKTVHQNSQKSGQCSGQCNRK